MTNALALIGARIRQAREKIGLSQEAFAEAVGKDQTAISQYENGLRKLPAVELIRFAEVLIVPVSYFFGEDMTLDSLDQLMLTEFRKLPTIEAKQAAVQIVRLLRESTDTDTR
ncbi:MAG: helix-turn-helix transcriptional regulator [Chloroflexi bacterium]|nr:helix-turn-helix transcriptional regulator [Chloroflexota bacterium]